MADVVKAPSTTFVSRPREDERTTRKPLAWWDRTKILLFLAALFFFYVWIETSNNPLLPVSEAFRTTFRLKWWLPALFGLELVRQLHFVLAEHWSAYYLWWQRRFEHQDARIERINPWTRFRIARVGKILFWIAVVNAFVAWRNQEAFFRQLVDLPATVSDFLLGTAADVPFIFSMVLTGALLIGQFALLFWFMSRGGTEVYFPDDIKTRFSDVWGQDQVMERVKENLVLLEDPKSIESRGGHVPSGILLYGPPGTGKTLMAEAVAGETGKPYVFVEPGAFMNMFMGVGVLKVRSLFKKLRKLAMKFGGVIVFFDEADALGNRGAMGGAVGAEVAHEGSDRCHGLAYISPGSASAISKFHVHEREEVGDPPRRSIARLMMGGLNGGGGDPMALQALLAELSGLKKPRGFVNRHIRRLLGMRPKPPPHYRILMMMATNRPDSLDQALMRPGRIDRIYRVGYPSKPGRVRTYEGYLSKVKHDLTPEQVEKLAVMTPYATGATIKDLVNESLIGAIRDGRDTITWKDVLEAKHLKSLGPSRDVELVGQDRHGVAIHEACHAIIAYRARKHLEIDLATIDPGNEYLGMVASIRLDDRFKQFKSEYEADIMVSLASLAGERMFFDGDSASGVSGDLQQATELAIMMEGFWGMGSTIASHAVTTAAQVGGGGPPVGKDPSGDMLRGTLGQRVEEKLAGLLDQTAQMLENDRVTVLSLAHALEQHKTLSGEDVIAVIEGQRGPVIDGSQYADPEFVQWIESYHDSMLEAHRHDIPDTDIEVPRPPSELPVIGVFANGQRANGGADAASPVPVGATPVAGNGAVGNGAVGNGAVGNGAVANGAATAAPYAPPVTHRAPAITAAPYAPPVEHLELMKAEPPATNGDANGNAKAKKAKAKEAKANGKTNGNGKANGKSGA